MYITEKQPRTSLARKNRTQCIGLKLIKKDFIFFNWVVKILRSGMISPKYHHMIQT